MPEVKTQVLIELQLEMKKLKGQMKEFMDSLKASQKQIRDMTKEGVEKNKEYLKSIEEIGKAQQKVAQQASRAEKQKQDAINKTSRGLKDQQKKLAEQAKFWDKIKSAPGGFGRGMMAGAGLSGLTQNVTARGAGGLMGRGISAAVGGVANFFMSGISNAYQQFMQLGQARGGLVGLGTPGQMRAGRRAGGGVGGAGLGFNAMETALQARGVGRATGNIGAVFRAQQFARAYGMDVGEAGGYMGMLRQAGYGFGGQVRGPGGQMQAVGRQGTRELQKIIEAGMISGLEKGRIGEFLQGVSSITGQLGAQLPGKINVSGIAAQAAVLGQSKLPGFQGARGMQLLGRINQAIQAPGGGEAGQAMVLQALGFGKPGGGTRYYEALKMQEQGLNDPRNLPKIMKEVYSQLGDPAQGGRAMVNEEANLALKEMFGVSLRQAEELQNIQASNLSAEEKQKKIVDIMEASKPIEEQSLNAMKEGFGGVVKYTAGIFDRQAAIGGRVAKYFMALQDLQLKALKALVDWLPKLGEAVDYLKKLFLIESKKIEGLIKTFAGDPVSQMKQFLAKQEKLMMKAEAIPKAGEYQVGGQRVGAIQSQLNIAVQMLQQTQAEKKAALAQPGLDPTRIQALTRREVAQANEVFRLRRQRRASITAIKRAGGGMDVPMTPEQQRYAAMEEQVLMGGDIKGAARIKARESAEGSLRSRRVAGKWQPFSSFGLEGGPQQQVIRGKKTKVTVTESPMTGTATPGGNVPGGR